MKRFLGLLLCLLILSSFKEDKYYAMYRRAIQEKSVLDTRNFIVIIIKDSHTGASREHCTTANFLLGAIHKEYSLSYDRTGSKKADSIALSHQDRVFTFQDTEALKNVDLYSYSQYELVSLERCVNFDSTVSVLRSGQHLPAFDDKTTYMYAHILFKKGVATSSFICGNSSLFLSREY